MAETRFSDADLQEFADLINEKLEQARSDYDQLQRSLSYEDDNRTEDTAPTFKVMEDGSETMARSCPIRCAKTSRRTDQKSFG